LKRNRPEAYVFVRRHRYSICPMHPTFISDNPKTPCPICGMDLVPVGTGAEDEIEPDPVPGHAHVILTPDRIQTMGVVTAEVKKMNFAQKLRAYAKVAYDPTLDPVSRTARARIEISNPGNELKPEMYAEVEIASPANSVMAVPDDAVVSTGERDIVFVDKGNGVFEPREVTIGVRDGDFREIRSGLREREKVATGANFLLDSESKLKSALSAGSK